MLENFGETFHKHPLLIIGAVVIGALLIWFAFRNQGAVNPSGGTGAVDPNVLGANTALQTAQIGANVQTAQIGAAVSMQAQNNKDQLTALGDTQTYELAAQNSAQIASLSALGQNNKLQLQSMGIAASLGLNQQEINQYLSVVSPNYHGPFQGSSDSTWNDGSTWSNGPGGPGAPGYGGPNGPGSPGTPNMFIQGFNFGQKHGAKSYPPPKSAVASWGWGWPGGPKFGAQGVAYGIGSPFNAANLAHYTPPQGTNTQRLIDWLLTNGSVTPDATPGIFGATYETNKWGSEVIQPDVRGPMPAMGPWQGMSG
jgi:hypothetical protein